MMITPPQAGNAPWDSAARQEAPEIALIAFHPVVEIRLKMTTRQLPQYPNEYRENVVIRRPVKPNVAVHAGSMQEKTLTRTMMAKLSQKLRPIDGPTIPEDSVATAMLADSLAIITFSGRLHKLFIDTPTHQNVQAFHTCVVFSKR